MKKVLFKNSVIPIELPEDPENFEDSKYWSKSIEELVELVKPNRHLTITLFILVSEKTFQEMLERAIIENDKKFFIMCLVEMDKLRFFREFIQSSRQKFPECILHLCGQIQ